MKVCGNRTSAVPNERPRIPIGEDEGVEYSLLLMKGSWFGEALVSAEGNSCPWVMITSGGLPPAMATVYRSAMPDCPRYSCSTLMSGWEASEVGDDLFQDRKPSRSDMPHVDTVCSSACGRCNKAPARTTHRSNTYEGLVTVRHRNLLLGTVASYRYLPVVVFGSDILPVLRTALPFLWPKTVPRYPSFTSAVYLRDIFPAQTSIPASRGDSFFKRVKGLAYAGARKGSLKLVGSDREDSRETTNHERSSRTGRRIP